MKPTLLLISCVLLLRCATGEKKPEPSREQPAPQITPSLTLFSDTLKKLSPTTPAAIDSALRLYDMMAPHDSTGADSAAAFLVGFVQQVVAKQNERTGNDSIDYAALLNPAANTLSAQQKKTSSELHRNKLKLVSDGEGGVYLVPAYETILPTVKARTSAPVDNYLDLKAKEDTTPVFKDAGLAIDMTELADRLALSEQLLSQNLPQSFRSATARLNNEYTQAFIRGADNSPAIDKNTLALTEEFEKGYNYLLAKYPASKAAAKINVWLTVVKTGDKRKIDDYLKLLPDSK